MAKVLLVNFPFEARGMPCILPIQFAAIGSHLTARGHRVRIVDLNRETEADLFALLSTERFDFTGICFRNVLPMFWIEKFQALRKLILKLRAVGVEPIVGGPGFSLFYSEIFRRIPELHAGAIGEGEVTMQRVVEGEPWDTIPGLVTRTATGLRDNYPPEFLPGAQIPRFCDIPGLHFDDPNYLVGLQTYRGCNWSCAYCPADYLRGAHARYRPLEHVEEDLRFLATKGVEHLIVIDGVVNDPPDRVRQLLALFERLNHPRSWEAFFKPLPQTDDTTVAAFARAGATRFHVDVISGVEHLARQIGHEVELDQALRLAGIMRRHDIEGVFYFAYQLPGERLRDEARTVGHLRRFGRLGHKTYIYPFFAYPGTGFEKMTGKILEKGWFWHLRRLLGMVLRPTFLIFFKNMITLKAVTGPRPRPGD